MEAEVRMRLRWVQMYWQTGDAGLTCRRCGISRPTLRKWVRRYQAEGLPGLKSRSRRPQRSPGKRVFAEQEAWIRALRTERKLGARRIRTELIRLHGFHLSLAMVHKVLQRLALPRLKGRRWRRKVKRYQKRIPGERVQMDTIKIAPGLYQYTAIDDCTRFMVVALYPRRSAANAMAFLDYVLGQVRFPIQRIRTDRGKAFTAYKFQEKLAEYRIKWRPTRPRSPHLNGKVERVQKTCLDDLYATLALDTLDEAELLEELEAWQDHYNWHRVHGAIGQAPMDKLLDLWHRIPPWEEVIADYDPRAEQWRSQMLALQKFVS